MNPIQTARLAALLQGFEGRVIEAAVEKGTAPATTLRLGARVEGELIGQLAGGRSLIDVEGTVYSVRLPTGALPTGTTRLPLVVLQVTPSPSFGLSSGSHADSGSVRIAMSPLAAQLQTLVGSRSPEAANVGTSLPVVDAPPLSGEVLAQPLRLAIERSGLFYESHQAEWVGGRRALDSLKAEPQAELTARRLATLGSESRRVDSTADQELEAATARGTSSGQGTTVQRNEIDTSGTKAHPGIGAIVDRQLQTFGTQQIQWTGQIWPQQEMHWVIEEEGRAPFAEDTAATWVSRLHLELPRVGELDATVRLQGDQVRVELSVPAARVLEVEDAMPVLRSALEARGLRLSSIRVTDHESG